MDEQPPLPQNDLNLVIHDNPRLTDLTRLAESLRIIAREVALIPNMPCFQPDAGIARVEKAIVELTERVQDNHRETMQNQKEILGRYGCLEYLT